MSASESVALRVQHLDVPSQTLVLAHLVASRSEGGTVMPADVLGMFYDFALPAPAKIGNVFASLTAKQLLAKGAGRGVYRLTPLGVDAVGQELSGLDLVALVAEASRKAFPLLGSTAHSLVPVALAPPALVGPLRRFLEKHPFDRNVFGMTGFRTRKPGPLILSAGHWPCPRRSALGLAWSSTSRRTERSATICGRMSRRTCGPAGTELLSSRTGSSEV